MGFGSGRFDGGLGTDTLLLGSGTYFTNGVNQEGFVSLQRFLPGATETMLVRGFEIISSTTNPSLAYTFNPSEFFLPSQSLWTF